MRATTTVATCADAARSSSTSPAASSRDASLTRTTASAAGSSASTPAAGAPPGPPAPGVSISVSPSASSGLGLPISACSHGASPASSSRPVTAPASRAAVTVLASQRPDEHRRGLLGVRHHRRQGRRDVGVDGADVGAEEGADQAALALLVVADDEHPGPRVEQTAPVPRQRGGDVVASEIAGRGHGAVEHGGGRPPGVAGCGPRRCRRDRHGLSRRRRAVHDQLVHRPSPNSLLILRRVTDHDQGRRSRSTSTSSTSTSIRSPPTMSPVETSSLSSQRALRRPARRAGALRRHFGDETRAHRGNRHRGRRRPRGFTESPTSRASGLRACRSRTPSATTASPLGMLRFPKHPGVGRVEVRGGVGRLHNAARQGKSAEGRDGVGVHRGLTPPRARSRPRRRAAALAA